MKKGFFCLLAILYSSLVFSQPVVRHAEDFTIGTVLTFIDCNTAGVKTGSAGANQSWDFSGLTPSGDTVIEWMVAPSTTPDYAKYPSSNLVEKYSNGQYVYVRKTPTSNYLTGFSSSSVKMTYSNDALFTQRPITYQDKITDTFSTKYKVAGYEFNGTGQVVIEADGYGSLKLPTQIYDNVLRIKITQQSDDTMSGTGAVISLYSVSYAFFDTSHTSALLKIDSSHTSNGVTSQDVQYLLSETFSGIETGKPASKLALKGHFQDNKLILNASLPANTSNELSIFDMSGRKVYSERFPANSSNNYSFDLPMLAKGIYSVAVVSNKGGEMILGQMKLSVN